MTSVQGGDLGSRGHILVVDDELSMREYLELLFSAGGVLGDERGQCEGRM